jgi:hypothetical protein
MVGSGHGENGTETIGDPSERHEAVHRFGRVTTIGSRLPDAGVD